MSSQDTESDIVYCASGDGNIADEYAVHPTKGSRVPLCERCADAMRKLQEIFDNEVLD